MSLGPVMVDIAGIELSSEEREMLQHPLVGGVILFTRNYQNIEQLTRLVAELHSIREPHLLVTVDHEGGRVQRFRQGFTQLPTVGRLGEIFNKDKNQAKHYAEISGWLMASELRAVGIDFSFAPVLDLDRGVSTVIGDRAFHKNPEAVAELAHAYMSGMKEAGMEATGKHFPGHGAVVADSHLDLPIDNRPYADIYSEDILPFERMIHYGLAAIMPAHVVYTDVDQKPACFSSQWLQQILRNDLGFQGVIFSDDLSMGGAESMGSYEDRARSALQAGCDMVLVCNNPDGRDEVLDSLGDLDNAVSHLRLARMHGKYAVEWESLHNDPQWREAVKIVESYEPEPELDLD